MSPFFSFSKSLPIIPVLSLVLFGLHTTCDFAAAQDPPPQCQHDYIGPDPFEHDDTPEQASTINLRDVDHENAQCRKIYDFGDVDWVKFIALDKLKYDIKADLTEACTANLGDDCNVKLGLYSASDFENPIVEEDTVGNATANEAFTFRCENDGVYYLKVQFATSSGFGEYARYILHLNLDGAPTTPTYIDGYVTDTEIQKEIQNATIKINNTRVAFSDRLGFYFGVYSVQGSHEVISLTAEATEFTNYNAAVTMYANQILTHNIEMVPSCQMSIYYFDWDNDGYGDPNNSTQACTAPTGYVANNTDCIDYTSTVHPDAEEVCNEIDDNCNGQIDESGDADGDGMPDCYEELNGLNSSINDAFADKDLDGFSNLREFYSNKDPQNPADFPSLAADYDEDLDCDGLDFYHFTIEYGHVDCSVETPCWFNLNQDSHMDSTDLVFFAEDFGQ